MSRPLGSKDKVPRKPRGPRPLEERFWEKVARTDDGSCWLWTAYCHPSGYGGISRLTDHGYEHERAHRLSWEIHNGPVPDGLHVLHKCDNPPCVNPDHLFIGTRTDNMRDMLQKGRRPIGEDHPQSRLTAEAVAQIKGLLLCGWNCPRLGERFGVCDGTIWRIAQGQTWKAVAPKPMDEAMPQRARTS